MRVLAVPRSMDRSLENMPRNFLNIANISRFAEEGGGTREPGSLRLAPCPDKEFFRRTGLWRPSSQAFTRGSAGPVPVQPLPYPPRGHRPPRAPPDRLPPRPASGASKPTQPRIPLPMSALICGSLAYDTIMVFPDQFKNHILPDKVHILNVSFLVPRMRREFGGCAGNIAYNLKLLGGDPIPMATVGQDFGPYREWFGEMQIPL